MTMHTLQDLIALGETEEGQTELLLMLAELAGWKPDPELEDGALMGTNAGNWDMIPDYPNDLNACHEVAMGLKPELIDEYVLAIRDVVITQLGDAWESMSQGVGDFHLYNATALQRTIALILTLQKA